MVQFGLIDFFILIEDAVVDMHAKHFRSPGYRRPLRYPAVLLPAPAFHLHLAFFHHGRVTIVAFSSVKPALRIHLRLWGIRSWTGGLLHHIVVNNIDDHFGHFQHIFEAVFGCIVTHSPGG